MLVVGEPTYAEAGTALIGPGSAIVIRRGWRRSIEAVVLTGNRLDHYRRLLDRPDRPWMGLGAVSERAIGPGALLRVGRDLLARVPEPHGTRTYRFSDPGWQDHDAISTLEVAEPPDSAASAQRGTELRHARGLATFGDRALADENGSIFGYHRVAGRWERDSCLRLADPEPFIADGPESVKIAQVSGDRDATPTPWGEREPTLSRSRATAGVVGTDLGVRVDHDGRSFLLFGDTHWQGRPWLRTRDAVAELTPTGPREGLPGVRFHGSPLKIVGAPRLGRDRVTMREYDVPLDGFSHAGHLFAFFSSNHNRAGRVMGRSVLARAEGDLGIDPTSRSPIRFRVLGTFSDQHFINVSVQLRPAAEVPGCEGRGDVLLVWGSGPYRAGLPRLAVLDQDALAEAAGGRPPAGVRYWDGSGWSISENDAAPLFEPAALGELSVRWVPEAHRYLMLAASGPEDPIGHAITLRTSPQPWGPWSRRRRLLDWVGSGMAHHDPHTRFIKAAVDGTDPVGDQVFAAQARGTGAAYAPYFFDAHTDVDDLVLRYTLSTWNPYQVVLLSHRLPLASL